MSNTTKQKMKHVQEEQKITNHWDLHALIVQARARIKTGSNEKQNKKAETKNVRENKKTQRRRGLESEGIKVTTIDPI